MSFDSFISDLLATVFGGVALALLFFAAKEWIFALPPLSGRWYIEVQTTESAYNPFKGMVVRYVAMVWAEGHRLSGTYEKVWERSNGGGERTYTGRVRTRGRIEGLVEKRYVSPDRIYIHMIEQGEARESTVFHTLGIDRGGTSLAGRFTATAADSSGSVKWRRTQF